MRSGFDHLRQRIDNLRLRAVQVADLIEVEVFHAVEAHDLRSTEKVKTQESTAGAESRPSSSKILVMLRVTAHRRCVRLASTLIHGDTRRSQEFVERITYMVWEQRWHPLRRE